jgi:hypothetical protein
LLACIDQAIDESDESPKVCGSEGTHGDGWAEEDGIGSGHCVTTCRRQRHQLATPVIWVRLTFHETMGFEFVNDEGRVRGVYGAGFGEFGKGHCSVAQLEEDFAPPGAEAEAERLREISVAVVRRDEGPHEGPCPLSGIL